MSSRTSFLGTVVRSSAYNLLPSWNAIVAVAHAGAGNEVSPKPTVSDFYIAVVDEFFVQPIDYAGQIYRVKPYYITATVRDAEVVETKAFSGVSHSSVEDPVVIGPYSAKFISNKVVYEDTTLPEESESKRWETIREKISVLTQDYTSVFSAYASQCVSILSSLFSSPSLSDERQKVDMSNNNTIMQATLNYELVISSQSEIAVGTTSGFVEGSNETITYTDGVFEKDSPIFLLINEKCPLLGKTKVVKFGGWKDTTDPILLDNQPTYDYNGNQMFHYKDCGKLSTFSLQIDDVYDFVSSFKVVLSSTQPTSISDVGEWSAVINRVDGVFPSVVGFDPYFGDGQAYDNVFLWVVPVFSFNGTNVGGPVDFIDGYPSYQVPSGIGQETMSSAWLALPPYGYAVNSRIKILTAKIEAT
jgi:hypothetical protein